MTSTERVSTFRPWHLFLIASLLAATAGVLLAERTHPSGLVLLSVAVCAAGLAGLAVFRTLIPLFGVDRARWREERRIGQRAALEREKRLVLRTIKELEFDRAMGKLSDRDFEEMSARLRHRALGLMRQLDSDAATPAPSVSRPGPEPSEVSDARVCKVCSTKNDVDARYCKACGQAL